MLQPKWSIFPTQSQQKHSQLAAGRCPKKKKPIGKQDGPHNQRTKAGANQTNHVRHLRGRRRLKAEGCFGGARGSYSKPNIWVFPKIGWVTPKWMVFIMENLIKMDDLGKTHYFRKHPYGGIIILLFEKLQYLPP